MTDFLKGAAAVIFVGALVVLFLAKQDLDEKADRKQQEMLRERTEPKPAAKPRPVLPDLGPRVEPLPVRTWREERERLAQEHTAPMPREK